VGARLVGPVENDPHVVDHLGKPTLVFLGFTFRPDVCPTTLSELSSRLKELGRDADRLNILFITVDPERDTPEKFAIYLSSFHSRITGLSGGSASTNDYGASAVVAAIALIVAAAASSAFACSAPTPRLRPWQRSAPRPSSRPADSRPTHVIGAPHRAGHLCSARFANDGRVSPPADHQVQCEQEVAMHLLVLRFQQARRRCKTRGV
jgi:hypothetical protein